LDAATLLRSCDGDAALLARMTGVFQSDAPAQLAALEAAVRDGDTRRLRESAHKLRGLTAAFSSVAAAEAGVLEGLGAAGRLDGAAEHCDALAGMIRGLATRLTDLSVEELRAETGGDGPPL